MSPPRKVETTRGKAARARQSSVPIISVMTAFVESCLETVAGSAHAAERKAKDKPRAAKLVKLLDGRKNVLVTTHEHPDPDALASAVGLSTLLQAVLPGAKVTVSIKGKISGGVNAVFVREADLKLAPWDEAGLKDYDAILLVDVQPLFAFSPLPAGVEPLGVIDHHRGKRGKRLRCPFCDVRTDVGATASIIFSYFMELEVPIRPALGATLLYAIESDLAGAAGQPGELDNVALSSLTLIADPRKLYQMRYVDLPQSYYLAYAQALANAVYADNALLSHLESIDSLEQPAVMADFLLRFDKAQWALVTAVTEGKLVLSLRTSVPKASAADVMRRLLSKLGEGGGHRTKAGGFVKLETGSPAEVERIRRTLWRRYLRAVGVKPARGQRLIPAKA
jgi:nanoRNase/pAp phosphatase (c-di-AMP/oligoRNAs hydrolase)